MVVSGDDSLIDGKPTPDIDDAKRPPGEMT
jgi:hypothetical protein